MYNPIAHHLRNADAAYSYVNSRPVFGSVLGPHRSHSGHIDNHSQQPQLQGEQMLHHYENNQAFLTLQQPSPVIDRDPYSNKLNERHQMLTNDSSNQQQNSQNYYESNNNGQKTVTTKHSHHHHHVHRHRHNSQQYQQQNYQREPEEYSPSPQPVTCDPSIFRCTLNAIPESKELLDRSRLPFGLTLQPFADVKSLTILKTNITRCRYCRAYINPYSYIVDNRRWKCNLCYHTNDLPEEFSYDPYTQTMGNHPTSRPEMQCSTIEYIASEDYMLRQPQPPVYMFVFDVGSISIDCGLVHIFSTQLALLIDRLPGTGHNRAFIGFIGVDSALHFFQWTSPELPPKHLVVPDIDESFSPAYAGLVVSITHYRESIRSFIQSLPAMFESPRSMSFGSSFQHSTTGGSDGNALGTALTAAKDLISDVGGRITILLASLPTLGLGALRLREGIAADSSRTNTDISRKPGGFLSGSNGLHGKNCFVPQTEFYKSLALDCTLKQICVDIFSVGSRFMDLATISDVSKFTAGTVHHFPDFHFINGQHDVSRFEGVFSRYLTRKLGLEAVLRIRCSRGLTLHSFYGHFFVRSTDLLTLPNTSPDLSLGIQVKLEEPLGQQFVTFQGAVLYTSSRGDRRVRVHTLCLPVVGDILQLYSGFDVGASTSLLAKMAVDRAMLGSDLSDCREALINAVVDALGSYRQATGQRGSLTTLQYPPEGQLMYFQLYILGLIKNRAFYGGLQSNFSADQRVAAMLAYKSAPLQLIMLETCPSLYALHYTLTSIASIHPPNTFNSPSALSSSAQPSAAPSMQPPPSQAFASTHRVSLYNQMVLSSTAQQQQHFFNRVPNDNSAIGVVANSAASQTNENCWAQSALSSSPMDFVMNGFAGIQLNNNQSPQHQQQYDQQNALPTADSASPSPPPQLEAQHLPLSYEQVSKDGLYALDTGSFVYLYVCADLNPVILQLVFGVNAFNKLDEDKALPELENPVSQALHQFFKQLKEQRMFQPAPVVVVREDGPNRGLFTTRLIEDRTQSSHSLFEFVQHIQREIATNSSYNTDY